MKFDWLIGRKNPNCKYETLNDSFFKEVDSDEKAYLLGWIASDGTITSGSITIQIDKKDSEILHKLRDVVCRELPIKSRRFGKQVALTINSKEIVNDVCSWLRISSGKKDKTVQFPDLATDALKWAFIRGYFDGDGSVSNLSTKKTYPVCSISSYSDSMRMSIHLIADGALGKEKVEWSGTKALDFLAHIYDNAPIALQRKKELYIDWSVWVPSFGGKGNHGVSDKFRWIRTKKGAVPPTKANASDSGYDITIIDQVKSFGDVILYGTGIKIQPTGGFAFFVTPRSSISKTGYMLANSIGVIDKSYTGELLVALRKVDKSADDIKLPCKIAQLVPLPIVHVEFEEVEEFEVTNRNAGGFGSTGN